MTPEKQKPYKVTGQVQRPSEVLVEDFLGSGGHTATVLQGGLSCLPWLLRGWATAPHAVDQGCLQQSRDPFGAPTASLAWHAVSPPVCGSCGRVFTCPQCSQGTIKAESRRRHLQQTASTTPLRQQSQSQRHIRTLWMWPVGVWTWTLFRPHFVG